jgi:hypothetical protein
LVLPHTKFSYNIYIMPNRSERDRDELMENFEGSHEDITNHFTQLNNENKIDFVRQAIQHTFEDTVEGGDWLTAQEIRLGDTPPLGNDSNERELFVTFKQGRRGIPDEMRVVIQLNNSVDPTERTMLVANFKMDAQRRPIIEGQGAMVTITSEFEMGRAVIDPEHREGAKKYGSAANYRGVQRGRNIAEKNLALRRAFLAGTLTNEQVDAAYKKINRRDLLETHQSYDEARRFSEDRQERIEYSRAQRRHETMIDRLFGERYQQEMENMADEIDEVIEEIEIEIDELDGQEQATDTENQDANVETGDRGLYLSGIEQSIRQAVDRSNEGAEMYVRGLEQAAENGAFGDVTAAEIRGIYNRVRGIPNEEVEEIEINPEDLAAEDTEPSTVEVNAEDLADVNEEDVATVPSAHAETEPSSDTLAQAETEPSAPVEETEESAVEVDILEEEPPQQQTEPVSGTPVEADPVVEEVSEDAVVVEEATEGVVAEPVEEEDGSASETEVVEEPDAANDEVRSAAQEAIAMADAASEEEVEEEDEPETAADPLRAAARDVIAMADAASEEVVSDAVEQEPDVAAELLEGVSPEDIAMAGTEEEAPPTPQEVTTLAADSQEEVEQPSANPTDAAARGTRNFARGMANMARGLSNARRGRRNNNSGRNQS